MFPNLHSFLFGVLAFLVGHVLYMIGFHPTISQALVMDVLPYAVVVLGWAVVFSNHVAKGLIRDKREGLVLPIRVYSMVLALMWISALMAFKRQVHEGGWAAQRGWCALIGASFFFVSDMQLAWSRFVAPLSYGHLRVMSTYHIGQFCLAACIIKFE